jgi:hypothetical protein
MNYLLFHVGELPKHFYICVNNILSVDKQAKIYLASDKKINIKNVNVININGFDNLVDKKNQILSMYKDTNLENNPLWYASFLRVFALMTISSNFKLKQFVHFDNDVLIYEPFNKIDEKKAISNNKINITQHDIKNLVFGYSYFDSYENLKYLNDFFEKVLNNHTEFANNFNRGKNLNEMKILNLALENNPNSFSILPSLPYQGEIIFDPASYGQFLNGTDLKRGNYVFKRRYISTNQIVGRELKSKRISVKFENSRPIVNFENKPFRLMNLHVHSKNLNKYVSQDYKNYI